MPLCLSSYGAENKSSKLEMVGKFWLINTVLKRKLGVGIHLSGRTLPWHAQGHRFKSRSLAEEVRKWRRKEGRKQKLFRVPDS